MRSYLKFKVDEAKRTVVCIITGTRNDANDAISKIIDKGPYRNKTFSPEYETVEISDSFVGVAKCAPEDTFDVETGKTIALSKAKVKYYNAMGNALDGFIDRFTKEANEYLTALNIRASKSNCSLYRYADKLTKYDIHTIQNGKKVWCGMLEDNSNCEEINVDNDDRWIQLNLDTGEDGNTNAEETVTNTTDFSAMASDEEYFNFAKKVFNTIHDRSDLSDLDIEEEAYQEYTAEKEPKNYDTLNSGGD